MSCSPLRSAPLPSAMWLVPRAASSVPRPVDLVHSCVDVPTRLVLAARTLTSPAPRSCALACGSGTAVAVSAALTWSGVHVGCFWKSSATAPETTAVACHVPLPLKKRVSTTAFGSSVSMTEPWLRRDTIDGPGATRSTWRDDEPRDENCG